MSAASLFTALGNLVVARDVRAGDFVHHQGDFAETVSFVRSGQFLVEAYPIGGWEPSPIRFVGGGGLIGEEALERPEALRASTVRTLCDGRLGVVYRDDLQALTDRSSAAARTVMSMLVAGILASQGTLLAGVGGSAAQRVGRLLLHADASLGERPGSLLHLTQHDLARLAGVQRPTANRVLKEMEALGRIELRRSRVRVLDRKAMEADLDEVA